jgi:5-deoxy-glucuronate isomerase
VLLVLGNVAFRWEGREETGLRNAFIEEGPYCLHVSHGVSVTVKALADSEILVQRTENDRTFPSVFYRPEN